MRTIGPSVRPPPRPPPPPAPRPRPRPRLRLRPRPRPGAPSTRPLLHLLIPRPTMPRRTDLQRILLIGAGPIVIGQACEFDYSGTQGAKSLREEGYDVVLVNSNRATIKAHPELRAGTYVEPLE